jgi:hypothetical protein
MSIRAEIHVRTQEGRLQALAQSMSSVPDKRQIFLESTVVGMLNGPWVSSRDGRRAGTARALLESFLRGDQVVGRMPPSKNVNTVIALLNPADDGVWEFRIGDPRPGIRILGRFAEKDVFVATNWVNRENFRDPVTGQDDPRKWRDEMIRCKTIWNQLFPSYNPLIGGSLHEFISNARFPI